MLGDNGADSWLARLMETAATDADALLDRFLAQFGEHLSSDAVDALRSWRARHRRADPVASPSA